MTNKEKLEVVEIIKKEIAKNKSDKEIWEGILKLVEKSNFGRKNASVKAYAPRPQGRSPVEDMSANGDGVNVLNITKACNIVLGDYGSVSVTPTDLAIRSIILNFYARSPA
ncbi:MAG: hypothetical protein HZC04_02120 [Candidatus Lloydbacteria bacterium]|nr:hypothetical protein [Candidatus Lloydbacteria bacterium]